MSSSSMSMSISIIIIIIIIILVITFTHGIYNYIPETRNVSRVCDVAAVLYLQFLLHVMLFLPCTFTSTLPAVRVQCPIWLFFCSSLISCFASMFLVYFLSDFEMAPFAPVVTVSLFLSHATCAEFL